MNFVQMACLLEISQAEAESFGRRSALSNTSARPSLDKQVIRPPSLTPTMNTLLGTSSNSTVLQRRVACLEGDAAALRTLNEDELVKLIEQQNRAMQEAQRMFIRLSSIMK